MFSSWAGSCFGLALLTFPLNLLNLLIAFFLLSSIDTNYLVDFRALDQHDPRPLVRKDNFQPALVGGAFYSAMSFSLCTEQTILNYFFNLAIHLWPSEPLFNSKQGFGQSKVPRKPIFVKSLYHCFPHCFRDYDFSIVVGKNPVIQDYYLFIV